MNNKHLTLDPRKNWEYKEVFQQLPMSEDYDGHYEVTNGNISLCTTDDPEDITETENTLQRVVVALNESGCKFYVNTSTEHALHIENMLLRGALEDITNVEVVHDGIVELARQALASTRTTQVPKRKTCLVDLKVKGDKLAADFAEWLYQNRWFQFENGKWYYTFEQGTCMSDKGYQKNYVKTTEQLYDIFKAQWSGEKEGKNE